MANMISNSPTWLSVGGVATASAAYMAWSLKHFFDVSKSGGAWRVAVLLLALLNFKNLPFVWHYRLLRGLLSHVTLLRRRPVSPGPSALFLPLITSSRSSLWETDYNLHKSNSTYFSDLDVGRMHLVACLMKTGLHKARYDVDARERQNGGRLAVILGGVTCNFRREIKPYEAYEIWTRVLAWDRKWLYLVSHVVRKDAVRPAGYVLQPWRKGGSGTDPTGKDEIRLQTAVLATSIAKYVFKAGRLTIPPEKVLQDCELLPPKLDGCETPPQSETPVAESISLEATTTAAHRTSSMTAEETADASLHKPAAGEIWDWSRVEEERARGLRVAMHMAELDALQEEFTAESRPALGRW